MLKVRIKKDFKRLDRIDKKMHWQTEQKLYDVARALIQDVNSHWSSKSPAAKGMPPAKVTGNLEGSAKISSSSRNPRGQFTSGQKDKPTVFVLWDTRKGPRPMGRGNYASKLEFIQDHPFVQPAVERMRATFPDFLGGIVPL